LTAAALYLYCVLPAAGELPRISSPALDGGPVHTVRCRELAAVAHACAPEPYQGSAERVRGWIAAHNAVVEEVWESAASVLPMSFDVIVRGGADRSAEASLVGWLTEHYEALCGRLHALEGRAEVGVQVLWDIAKLAGPGAAGRPAPEAPARGRAYFACQQHRRQVKEELERRASEDCRRHLANLTGLAEDVQVNKVRPVPGKQMVLNLSLLVTPVAVSRVGEYLERVSQEPGIEVRFTGPWPPYSHAGTFGAIGGGGRDGGRPEPRKEVDRL
jgi:gas vesicle protein GvpL/GvpF